MPLYKFSPEDVKVAHPNTDEWCIVHRTAAITLHARGLIHPGEEGHMLADGVEWHDLEAALRALGCEV